MRPARRLWFLLWLTVLAWAVASGCQIKTLFEPAVCIEGDTDTVGTVVRHYTDGTADTVQRILWQECATWQAMSDSTKCWDGQSQRVSCAP